MDVYNIVIDGNSAGNERIMVEVEERGQRWSMQMRTKVVDAAEDKGGRRR